MIGALRGQVAKTGLKAAIIDVGGVGYRVQMPLRALSKLNVGDAVNVCVHTHVREDAIDLFAFEDETDQHVFERLIAISGVGPKLALTVLSSLDVAVLRDAVATRDIKTLTKVPGVGKKTAERMAIELEGKLDMLGGMLAAPVQTAAAETPEPAVLGELKSALVHLGYKPAQVEKVAAKLREQAAAGAGLETLVRDALRQI